MDDEPSDAPPAAYAQRLTEVDRQSSLAPPGAADGPLQLIYATEREAIYEIRNRTVHAFLVLVLIDWNPGYHLYWAVYVKPVGQITGRYMRLIDPFRR